MKGSNTIVYCFLIWEWEVVPSHVDPLAKVNIVLADHIIIQDQVIYVPNVAVCDAVAEGIVHVLLPYCKPINKLCTSTIEYIPFSLLKIYHSAGTKGPMTGTCRGANSSDVLTPSHYEFVIHCVMFIAGCSLIGDVYK